MSSSDAWVLLGLGILQLRGRVQRPGKGRVIALLKLENIWREQVSVINLNRNMIFVMLSVTNKPFMLSVVVPIFFAKLATIVFDFFNAIRHQCKIKFANYFNYQQSINSIYDDGVN